MMNCLRITKNWTFENYKLLYCCPKVIIVWFDHQVKSIVSRPNKIVVSKCIMGPDVKETSIFSFYNITKQSFAVYNMLLLLNKIKIIIENIPNSTAGGGGVPLRKICMNLNFVRYVGHVGRNIYMEFVLLMTDKAIGFHGGDGNSKILHYCSLLSKVVHLGINLLNKSFFADLLRIDLEIGQ